MNWYRRAQDWQEEQLRVDQEYYSGKLHVTPQNVEYVLSMEGPIEGLSRDKFNEIPSNVVVEACRVILDQIKHDINESYACSPFVFPQCPVDFQKELVDLVGVNPEGVLDHLTALFENHNMDSSLIEHIWTSGVAGNLYNLEDVYSGYSTIDGKDVVAGLVGNPNCPPDIIWAALVSPAHIPFGLDEEGIRSMQFLAVLNPSCPSRALVELLASSDKVNNISWNAASHPNCPNDVALEWRHRINTPENQEDIRREQHTDQSLKGLVGNLDELEDDLDSIREKKRNIVQEHNESEKSNEFNRDEDWGISGLDSWK